MNKPLEKKGVINILTSWVELGFLILLIIGFFISLNIGSAFFSYIIIFLFGLMAGRFLQQRKAAFPFYLIVLGLLVGYILGAKYGSWKTIVFLFALSTVISWYAHDKGYVR